MSNENDEIVFQLEKLNSTLEKLLNEVYLPKSGSTASELLKILITIEEKVSELDWTNKPSTASKILEELDWTGELSIASQILKRLDRIEIKLDNLDKN